MKNIFVVLAFIFSGLVIFSSCKKASTETINETLIADTTAMLKFEGTFISGPYGTVSGLARVYLKQGNYIAALENFTSSNGPDLKVYLSKERFPVNFISLGSLKSTNGDQLYDVPGSPDFAEYKYLLIHCEQYNHLFGSAEIR